MLGKNLYRVNTSWLPGSGVMSLTALLLFALASGIMIINFQFISAYNSNNNTQSSYYDLSAYPLALILAVFNVFIVIYYIFNAWIWCVSYTKSMGKRKKFNLFAIIYCLIFSILFLCDCVLRLFFVFSNLSAFFNLKGSDPPLVVQNPSDPNAFWGFQPYLLMAIGLISFFAYGIIWYLQRKWFKTEDAENSKKDVKDHYRKIEFNRKVKAVNKGKAKNLSKKIKVF
ncbi:hypothetical protein [Malacoplasma iowae]|uniref:Uncharacterized protein n=1 Tax=Malacoplasma iowae DK-CPA TaxID=1394179 RepID=A0A084U2T2_MALIO|nr:hypothetical protein [Malacoplasma iowae]KFB07268.1 hypothetical protein P271_95 [Malacoplasma iowae DK-CPA]WPL37519.1 hypothetical protein QX182_03365 [Malacoplasma iowae]WPL38494.1 hypothetical protein QX181_02875 [Malacoplasma iowae]WPL40930.1 hypothetical protein QX184_05385 [Malacoplasma iowae]